MSECGVRGVLQTVFTVRLPSATAAATSDFLDLPDLSQILDERDREGDEPAISDYAELTSDILTEVLMIMAGGENEERSV